MSKPFILMDPSGVDYRDYKKRFGSCLTLFGNIDIMWPLVQGTPADVERDVQEHMDALKPAGRWVAGSSHSIVNHIPHDNLLAMINSIHRYGAYGATSEMASRGGDAQVRGFLLPGDTKSS